MGRVTDNEENLRWVGLNVPMTVAEKRVIDQTGMSLTEVRNEFG